MKDVIFLLTKDCMSLEALPIYGGCQYWKGKTPNIDEIASKGTVFYRHYTAAPSTSMAMSAMLTGHYLHEFEKRMHYVNVSPSEKASIFDKYQKKGYECHLIWDTTWMGFAWRFVREFGDETKTQIHNLDIAQPAGGHKRGRDKNRNVRNEELLDKTYKQIYEALESIDLNRKQFIWVHLPHILKGRRCYMDDIDVFDNIVGFARKMVGDDSIVLSTDHGHMNMHKHKVGYGFDVYEHAIHIPLITPRINGYERVDSLTSNIDIPEIIEGNIPHHDYVISDTKYYAQPHRVTAVVGERYKLIHNADTGHDELYDLKWDPEENYDINNQNFYDVDRKITVFADEYYFYPYTDEAKREYQKLDNIRKQMWREPTFKEKAIVNSRLILRQVRGKLGI